MKTRRFLCLLSVLVSLSGGSAMAAETLSEAQAMAIFEAYGNVTCAYLAECYLSLVAIERLIGTERTKLSHLQLAVQANLLKRAREHVEKLEAQFPKEKGFTELTGNIKDTAKEILALNEALRVQIVDQKDNLPEIRARHASARALLIRVLNIPNGEKNMP